jgi:hypothetical protein
VSSIATQIEFSAVQRVDSRARRLRVAENIFLFTIAVFVFNIAAMLVRFRHGHELPINPFLAVLSAIAILIADPPKQLPSRKYFPLAWFFVATFTLIGAASIPSYSTLDFKTASQDALKLAINFLLVPWMAMRLASPRLIRRCFQLTIAIVAVGGVFAAAQLFSPKIFGLLLMQEGRGSGFWINPNSCGTLCVVTLLLSFIWPYRKAVWNILARVSILAGVVACSSRAAAGAVVIAFVIVLLLRKNLTTAVWVTVSAALVYVLITSVDLGNVISKITPDEHRAASFARLAGGDAGAVVQEDIRWRVWQYSGRVAMEYWATGCGLTCMDHVAPFAGRGLGPHNFYIYVLGTAGFMALIAFLILLGALLKWAFQLENPQHRSLSVAVVACFAFLLFFDHASVIMQALSPIMVFFAVIGAEQEV